MRSQVDYSDVQGLVRYGYGRMKEASYVLARIKNAEAARAWLRGAPVADAVQTTTPPPTALQIAFTAEGLRVLGVPAHVISGFSDEFIMGMTGSESRSRRLGDVGANAPSRWQWGGAGRVPHLLIMLFAQPGLLENMKQSISAGPVWDDAFEESACLDTTDLNGIEPFSFTDGISQPELDWPQQRNLAGDTIEYGNIVALGEFLLGYRNEYGKYTDRPLLDPDGSSSALLGAEDAPTKKDLGRNGTYLVMRHLKQDVRAFWQYIGSQSGNVASESDKLGAAFVGRMRNGDSLVPMSQQPIPGIGSDPQALRMNQFTFESDPDGVRCPFGAHIRRANPRNADYPGRPAGLLAQLIALLGFGTNDFREDLISSVRFHRILRRGREYGPGLSPADALAPAPPNESERGLRFICLNANILRQFEFVQNAWIMSAKFDGMTGESDPLLGNRVPIPGCPNTSNFNMPRKGGVRRRITGLPQFVTVRGGAYFFLPSMRALRYFASVGAA